MEGRSGRDETRPVRKFNKKRKKSFLMKERAQGKRGRFGRGSDIGGDTFNYFLRVLEVKLADFSNTEDKEIFIDNVFEQTAGREVNISCNQLGSRAMEVFLPLAHDKILLRFTYAFSKDLRKICCDEFGSHVLQQLIVVVSSQLQKNEDVVSNEGENKESQSTTTDMVVRFKNWLQQVCKFVVNNLEEFLWDKFANHVVRTVLECLSGLPAGSTSKDKKSQKKEQSSSLVSKIPPLADGHTLIEDCGNRFRQMSQIIDIVYTDLTSGLLQTLLCALHKVNTKLANKTVRHLLDCCYDPKSEDCPEDNEKKKFDTRTIPAVFVGQATTRLMDVMISIASRKIFTQIYARCFINRLKMLSLAPDANFCVQNLIRHSTEKLEFEAMFDELSSNFEALLLRQKHGVLLSLGQTCQRLGTKQGQFIKEFQTALHCAENERQALFPVLVIYFVNYETWCENKVTSDRDSNSNLPVSLSGSLLLQSMLNFPETIKIVKALLDMDCDNLKHLLCDPRGSHIADEFFASKTVGEKSREKMCRKLQGSYVALAVSKHGSRALEAVWGWAPLKYRMLILEDLAPREALVNSTQWGNIFCDKSGLSLFKRRPKDWEELQTREVRAHRLFADIIGDM